MGPSVRKGRLLLCSPLPRSDGDARVAAGRVPFRFRLLGKRPGEHDIENLIHGFDEMDIHVLLDDLREVLEIGPVVKGQDGFADSLAVGGEELFLDSPDGENLALQGDLSAHGDALLDRDLGQ